MANDPVDVLIIGSGASGAAKTRITSRASLTVTRRTSRAKCASTNACASRSQCRRGVGDSEGDVDGATSWETRTTTSEGGGGVVALTILAAALLRYRAQRAARRAFYESKAWKDYVARRDGEEA